MYTSVAPLKQRIGEEIRDLMFYNESYLDPDNQKCTSSDYFKEISYFIDLKELYTIIDSCYYHQAMPFVPVFLRIGQQQIRDGYGNFEYLLQVWNKKKERVYQKPVKHVINNWVINFQYLVYTILEDDGTFLYIIDLEDSNKEIKVKNFGTTNDVKYISYNAELLFAATSTEIKVCQISTGKFGEGNTIDASNLKVRTITPGLTIHGLICNKCCATDKFQLVAYETEENILDFNRLFIENINDDSCYKFHYTQYREIVPRKVGYVADPIQKACFVFNEEGYNYSLARRISGGVDIYWNMLRIESTEGQNVVDIDLTPSSFYFKLSDGHTYGFDHKNNYAASFQQIELISPDDLEWDNIVVKKVHNTVYLYTGIMLLILGNYGVNSKYIAIISHGKFVSVYNIQEKKWTNHMIFCHDIEAFFSHQAESGALYTSLITKNGQIYTGFLYNDGTRTAVVPEDWLDAHAEGTLISKAQDWMNQKTFFIIHKNKEKLHLSMLYQEKLQVYDQLLTAEERVAVVCILFNTDNAYFVIQNASTIALYQTVEKDGKFQPILIRDFPEFPEITGTLHSGASYDPEKNLFLFDEKNMYVIKTNPIQCIVYDNVYCIGIQSYTKSYTYALCQDVPEAKNPGLRVFDMESIINRNKSGMVLVKKIDVGTQGSLDYTYNLIRMGMVKSLTHLVIFPILHRNMNKFMAMAFPKDYITYKVINDKMLAFTLAGGLYSWDLMTCKFLTNVKLEDQYDYSNYELYSKYKQNLILLRSKDTISNIQDSEFFETYQFKTNTDNQKNFLNQAGHTYKTWKWIEIMNEKEIKVHAEYIRPHFSDWQYVFLNKEKDRLIEVLSFFRCFFYKRVSIPGEPDHKCKWQLIRRIEDYPTDLQIDYQRLQFFSPSFSRYIVADKKEKQFVIKDSYTDQVVARIPKELMTFEQASDAKLVLNRMNWINESKFLIVSEDGIEKTVDVTQNFLEIDYNYRPLFNEIMTGYPEKVEWKEHYYYLLREDLKEQDTLKRLQRVYQQYKTSYFLMNRRLGHELYQDIMTVDPFMFNFNHLSFTFLHWSLIEQIKKGDLTVDELEDEVIQQILYNFLPGGNTVFHILTDNPNQLIALLKRSHPNLDEEDFKYHIPFLPNFKGQTPIHNCVERKDYKTIDAILKYLKYYPTDHHSRGIKDMYGELIAKQQPEFINYLDCRFLENEQTKTYEKGAIKDGSMSMAPFELWFRDEEFKESFMNKAKIETRVKCEIFDMPGAYHVLDSEFQQVFEALAQTDKMEFFDLRAIQKLVDFNYPLVREYVLKRLFIPYCLFQLIYCVYMNVFYDDPEQSEKPEVVYPFMIAILILATYFLVNEVKQLIHEGRDYFVSFWNYVDIIPPVGIYIIFAMVILQKFDIEINGHFERCVLALITFFMWFKFLYFLRIFKNTGYLIRMIFEVVMDMRNFFVVILICIVAFGDSFLRISMGNEEDERFTEGFWSSIIYTYQMILGNFDTNQFGVVAQPLVMILFLLCTIFNMIVMLNLLIAIISESFEKVTNLSSQATYQERAIMIEENHYLIPIERKKSYAKQGKYLLVVTDLEATNIAESDPINTKLHDLKLSIKANQSTLDSRLEKINKKQQSQDAIINRILALNNLLVSQTIKIKTSVHKNLLQMVTYEYLRSKNPQYKDGWFCDGKKISGCRGAGGNSNTEAIIYHCKECKFDYCEGCFAYYGDDHTHKLEKLTLKEVQEHHGGYGSWGCDGRKNPSKCLQVSIKNDNDYIYHDFKEGYDLCTTCAERFKVE